MKRFHVHTRVTDLQSSIAFYTRLFHTLADIPVFNDASVPLRGKPLSPGAKPASSCC
jgi:hypothetical protein